MTKNQLHSLNAPPKHRCDSLKVYHWNLVSYDLLPLKHLLKPPVAVRPDEVVGRVSGESLPSSKKKC